MQGNIKALQNIYKISFLESLSILLFFRFLFLLPNINFLHHINRRKCKKGTVLYFKSTVPSKAYIRPECYLASDFNFPIHIHAKKAHNNPITKFPYTGIPTFSMI